MALLGLWPGNIGSGSGQAATMANEVRRRAERLPLRELARLKVHHGAQGFLNPFSDVEYGNFLRVLSWKLLHRNEFKSFYDQEPVTHVTPDWDTVRRHQGLSLTYLKHASLLIKDRDRYLLVDPVFGPIFRFIKDFSPLNFDLADMPRPDVVLITHGHYDHLDLRSLTAVASGAHVVTPLGYDRVLDGLATARRTRLDWFDSAHDGRREIMLVPCNHWTMRNPLIGPNRSLWGSYIIKSAAGPVLFISGDAGYFNRYEELGREFDIDLAVFNLGAYEPRWFMKSSHMNPAEVVRAFQELGAKRLMIVHWGTFRLGDEPVHFPPLDIRKEMARQGLSDRLIHLDHGRTLLFEGNAPGWDRMNPLSEGLDPPARA